MRNHRNLAALALVGMAFVGGGRLHLDPAHATDTQPVVVADGAQRSHDGSGECPMPANQPPNTDWECPDDTPYPDGCEVVISDKGGNTTTTWSNDPHDCWQPECEGGPPPCDPPPPSTTSTTVVPKDPPAVRWAPRYTG